MECGSHKDGLTSILREYSPRRIMTLLSGPSYTFSLILAALSPFTRTNVILQIQFTIERSFHHLH